MSQQYKNLVLKLVQGTPYGIDQGVQSNSRPPSMASSEFLTNKEQGDWAEQIVFNAINGNSAEFVAVRYGKADSLSAGDPGFEEFWHKYIEELNSIGKRPDLLIFKKADYKDGMDLTNPELVGKAVAAIEVRSSSFLANKYVRFMEARALNAQTKCNEIRTQIISEPNRTTLKSKDEELFAFIENATASTFRELDFRARSWSSTPALVKVSELLKELKEQINILHKRDYLSITPKLEDIALVNRWIQVFGVKHFYLQVFFDKAYIIPFTEILEISSDPGKEDICFSVEKDVKNQGKTTIKINVQIGKEILGRIDMPEHKSMLKEFERGRLLFYVSFVGGKGYLDQDVLKQAISHV
jgi:AccI restriction endonuclease